MKSQYIKPRSVTFWAGASMILGGMILGVTEVITLPNWMMAVGGIVDEFSGGMGAGTLISTGLGFVGVRRAIGDRE